MSFNITCNGRRDQMGDVLLRRPRARALRSRSRACSGSSQQPQPGLRRQGAAAPAARSHGGQAAPPCRSTARPQDRLPLAPARAATTAWSSPMTRNSWAPGARPSVRAACRSCRSGPARRSSRSSITVPRQVAEGEPRHRQAMLGRAHGARLVPGLPGRKDAQLVQPQLLERRPRQRHVGAVRRIEGAAEHAQPRLLRGRGVKPSPCAPGTCLYRSSSGEPGPGWRW